MSRSSIKSKRKLTIITALVMMLSLAVQSITVSADSKGSITLNPQHDSATVSGCTFDLYQVASYDGGDVSFALLEAFEGSVDINGIKSATATQREEAANVLASLITDVTPDYNTTSNGNNVFKDLNLGVYLVVQTLAPANYTMQKPFLVFLPSTDNNGNLINDVTAYPKLGYTHPSPGGDAVNITAVKVWNDNGYSDRPASVEVALYRGGALSSSATLSDSNNWTFTWSGLAENADWSVKEVNVPSGYTSTVSNSGGVYTITNTRNAVVIDGKLTVTKVWVNDSIRVRPSSVEVTLYRNGERYDSVTLNENNSWGYEWSELDENIAWTVAETSSHADYTASITTTTGGYIVSNTYNRGDGGGGGGGGFDTSGSGGNEPDTPIVSGSSGGSETVELPESDIPKGSPDVDVPDSDIPKGSPDVEETVVSDPAEQIEIEDGPVALADISAPQTGLVQWPIPVLLTLGIMLLLYSYGTERKSQYA